MRYALYGLLVLALFAPMTLGQEIVFEKQWDADIGSWDQTFLKDMQIVNERAFVLFYHAHFHRGNYFYTFETFDVKNFSSDDTNYFGSVVNLTRINRWELSYFSDRIPPAVFYNEELEGNITLDESLIYLPDVTGAAYQFDLNGQFLQKVNSYIEPQNIQINNTAITFPFEFKNDTYTERIELKDTAIFYNDKKFTLANINDLNRLGDKTPSSSYPIYYDDRWYRQQFKIFSLDQNMFFNFDPKEQTTKLLNAESHYPLDEVPFRFEPESEEYFYSPDSNESQTIRYTITFIGSQISNGYLYQIESNKYSMVIYLACYKIHGLEEQSAAENRWEMYE